MRRNKHWCLWGRGAKRLVKRVVKIHLNTVFRNASLAQKFVRSWNARSCLIHLKTSLTCSLTHSTMKSTQSSSIHKPTITNWILPNKCLRSLHIGPDPDLTRSWSNSRWWKDALLSTVMKHRVKKEIADCILPWRSWTSWPEKSSHLRPRQIRLNNLTLD